MRTTRTRIFEAALLAATFALDACNGGGSDPSSACNDYCHHAASCEGVSGSVVDMTCNQTCAEAGALGADCLADSGAPVTAFYNCLAGLPCSDFALDGDGAAAILACVQQSGCQ